MREVEIYREVERVLDEHNKRMIDVRLDPYGISVSQNFQRDQSLSAARLLEESGFDVSISPGMVRGFTTVDIAPYSFRVRADSFGSEYVLLEVQWFFDLPESKRLREGTRALNRIFNLMKAKLEDRR